jgi:hypothetical protein
MTAKKNIEPIIVYWGPNVIGWNLLYPDPKNLFLSISQQKNKNKKNKGELSFFSCPAFKDKTQNIYSFSFPMDVSYEWDFSNNNQIFKPTNDQNPFIGFKVARTPCINNSPQIEFSLFYSFFCEEPLKATFSAPYFSEPNYTKSASVAPGTMDIGQWFRAYPIEMTFWKEKGTINFKDGESLFYVEFLTDRPVILKRYNTTEKILSYSEICGKSPETWSSRIPLVKRYQRFNDSKMSKVIMKEIKENLL